MQLKVHLGDVMGRGILAILIIFTSLVSAAGPAMAQATVEVTGPNGEKVTVPADKADEVRKQMAARAAKAGEAGQPAEGEKKPEGEEKPKEKSDEPKAPAATTRPAEAPEPADPAELEVRPDDDGRVEFGFRNQAWPALMEWLAEISEMPLDWQELPGDFVNLASPGRYTVEETRDLLNRHLLARGYTMLQLDGGLTVVKTEGINPAMVPRVEPAALATLPAYSFVRTSLDCGWLLAPKLAEELKPMISGNGKLVALEQTNRIEAMDAAINLKQIADLMNQEQSAQSRSELAREFELRHLPADEAHQMLSAFLGIKEEKEPPMTPQQMQQMQQMRQQQAQQNGGKLPGLDDDKPKVAIVVNNRRNSLLVNAPPDRMAVAAQFIAQIDVPGTTLQSLADVERRFQVFRLTSLDPEKLAEIAGDMNILEASTRLRVDDKNKALIVTGSAADQFIIKSLIDRLDGSARSFEVLQLRRLDAQDVADSIMFLMGTEEKDDQNSRRPYYYSFYGSGNEEKKETDKFRVAANVRFRQVLLWANELEMQEVRSLLVKLGEIPPEGGSGRNMRVIEASPTPETYEYLRRLQEHWKAVAPNELVLPEQDRFVDPMARPAGDEAEEADAKADGSDAAEIIDGRQARGISPGHLQFVSNPSPPEDQTQELPRVESGEQFEALFGNEPPQGTGSPLGDGTAGQSRAAVRIELDDSGNLILLSDDPAALDRLESMMLEVEPPKRPYTVFRVRHASATWMMLNLEDYFKDDEKTESTSDSFFRYYWGMPAEDEKKDPGGLGKSQPLRFVADNDTGSIVVTGASPSQLKTIGELVELWDVPEPTNKRQSRFTRLVRVRFSRAEKVAETVKEAYRDLLSSNDKAFAQGGQRGGGEGGGSSTDRGEPRDRNGSGSSLINSEGGRTSGESNFTFKGKLSIGVDPIGNTLLVSAEGDALLDLVCEMIDQLDTAARPQGEMKIREMPGTISVGALETALRAFSPQTASPQTGVSPRSPPQDASSQANAGSAPNQSRGEPAQAAIDVGN